MSSTPPPIGLRPIHLRPIGPFDLEIVAALHAGSFEDAWTVGAVAAILAAPGAFGLIAEIEGEDGPEPAGFVLIRRVAEECEILSLGVAPRHRRRGIARTLVRRANTLATRGGAGRIFLEVAEDNLPALGLYRELGFAEVGRRKGYYRRRGSGGDAAALVMRRTLPRRSALADHEPVDNG